MSNKEFVLERTKTQFKLRGIVSGTQNEFFFNEGTINSGKNEGKRYKSVRFKVATSPNNRISVELFGMERDKVYPYSSKDKKTIELPWNKRFNPPDGYKVIGVGVGLEQDEEGNTVRKNYTDYDAVEAIKRNLHDGDCVQISGEIQFQQYVKNDETFLSTKYVIKNIFRQDEIDFEDEKFEPLHSFQADIVVVDSEYDKDENKIYLNTYHIPYNNDGDVWVPAKYVVDCSNVSEKFAKNMKGLKFGDFITVYGHCINGMVLEEEEEDEWGGVKPKGFNVSGQSFNELQITGVDAETFVKKRYREDDFVVKQEFASKEDDAENPFIDSNGQNPFEDR